MKFEEFGLSLPVLNALSEKGYENPTPIQAKAIPHILKGEDLLGSAQTGTGKTAAFAIPMIQNLTQVTPPTKGHGRKIRALVLAPTRELASQILDNFLSYGKNTPLKYLAIYGGVSQFAQEKSLQRGVDIVVATPGRLVDLLNQRIVDLSSIKILVLDEADRMLDMGFLPDIKNILSKLPSDKQTLFFSATMQDNVLGLANSLLKNPAKVHIETPKTDIERIEQRLFLIPQEQKSGFLVHFIKKEHVNSAVIFTRTKRGADRMVARLKKSGIHSEAIHSDKTQATRQRTLDSFRAGYLKFLVATDIAARGIDVDHVSHVVNYDLPREPETYTHRIGRTGRAGASGTAISLCDRSERGLLREIEKFTGKRLPLETAEFSDPEEGNEVETGTEPRKPRFLDNNFEKQRPNGNPDRQNRQDFKPWKQNRAGSGSKHSEKFNPRSSHPRKDHSEQSESGENSPNQGKRKKNKSQRKKFGKFNPKKGQSGNSKFNKNG